MWAWPLKFGFTLCGRFRVLTLGSIGEEMDVCEFCAGGRLVRDSIFCFVVDGVISSLLR